jgi:hypothetical protein
MYENKKGKKTFFYVLMKTGILISDLYFYSIKIQTDINPKWIENYATKSEMFLKMYNFFN